MKKSGLDPTEVPTPPKGAYTQLQITPCRILCIYFTSAKVLHIATQPFIRQFRFNLGSPAVLYCIEQFTLWMLITYLDMLKMFITYLEWIPGHAKGVHYIRGIVHRKLHGRSLHGSWDILWTFITYMYFEQLLVNAVNLDYIPGKVSHTNYGSPLVVTQAENRTTAYPLLPLLSIEAKLHSSIKQQETNVCSF